MDREFNLPLKMINNAKIGPIVPSIAGQKIDLFQTGVFSFSNYIKFPWGFTWSIYKLLLSIKSKFLLFTLISISKTCGLWGIHHKSESYIQASGQNYLDYFLCWWEQSCFEILVFIFTWKIWGFISFTFCSQISKKNIMV